MYLGKPGDIFNGGCTLLRQETVNTVEDKEAGAVTISSIVLAFTSKYAAEPFVTWSRWQTFDLNGEFLNPPVYDSCAHGHYFRQLTDKVIEDFEQRVEEITHAKRDEKAIRERGENDGKAAASWLIDGNTKEPFKVLSAMLDGINHGDPATLDELPQPRVGGEFADDPTWEDICRDEIERYDDDGEDGLFGVYCDAFHEGVVSEITRLWDVYRPDWSVK